MSNPCPSVSLGAWTDGQKLTEETYEGGKLISAKYWNSRGEAVETYEEAKRWPPPPRQP